jgi:hypothetical protein
MGGSPDERSILLTDAYTRLLAVHPARAQWTLRIRVFDIAFSQPVNVKRPDGSYAFA